MTGVCELPFQAMLLSGTIETRTSCVFSLTCESTVPGCGHRLVARIFQFIILSPHPEVRIELTFGAAIVRGNPISLQHRVVSCSDAYTPTTAQPWWRAGPQHCRALHDESTNAVATIRSVCRRVHMFDSSSTRPVGYSSLIYIHFALPS